VDGVQRNGAMPTMLQAMRDREADLERIERELAAEPEHLQTKLTVLPSWAARQLDDIAGLLQDEPERARMHFQRIGLSFAVSPVLDAPQPFLRAVGSADVLHAAFSREFDLSASDRSHPQSEERTETCLPGVGCVPRGKYTRTSGCVV